MYTPPAAARRLLVLAGACCLAAGCTDAGDPGPGTEPLPPADGRLFTRLPSSATGVRFENRVTPSREFNVFTFRHFYNGGGVGIGDLDGDGRPDLVLTANMGESRIYRNEGDFRFRDVTRASRLAPEGYWTTGVSLADVDGDGRLDVYLSFAGDLDGRRRANELWINQGAGADGVPTFVERAAQFGIADEGYSTQAVFFDSDGDGDLDLYLLNNSIRPVGSFGLRNVRDVRDTLGGDKLYRNDGGRFTDVSEAAGIFGSDIGFGLGVVVSDVDRDGHPDIYVANDFFERDYLYLNNGNGTYREVLDQQFPYVSYFSMGLDIADVDDDGWADIYVTDMLPADEQRLRLTSSFEGWDVHQAKVRGGYHHQFMRNMLHRNNGDGTFSDVGQMAGVARTDWSWSALLADFDLDGRKDLYVTNGLARDLTAQDYIAFLADRQTMAAATDPSAGKGRRVDYLRLLEAMQSTPLPNRAFRNTGDLAFADVGADWGLDTPGFSNGAAYADLDGDGALDLVVNNVDGEAFVYRNNARALTRNQPLQVVLAGEGANRFAVGAKVTVRAGGAQLYQELWPVRGFQSSMEYRLTFGVGERARVDSVTVEWPDGRTTTLRDVATGQQLVVRQAEAAPAPPAAAPAAPAAAAPTLLADVTAAGGLDWQHRENAFSDFDRERLIPKLVSTEGPAVAVADVNGDGLDDVYLGGAKDQPGTLLVQQADGRFTAVGEALFAADAISEDVGALFFDADGDGRPDLYVVSGGNEFGEMAPALQDRLYLNDGRGTFRKAAPDALPAVYASGSRAAAADVDGDGDLDLFVGGRVTPWRYGVEPQSQLLLNDGRGRFTDATARLAPALARIGMVTDAVWQDVDGDRRPDLLVVGEWMPIALFRNTGGGRLERQAVPGLAASDGWWNRIVAGDFTGDGRVDFVVGNLGLNTRLQADANAPVTMHVKDFDRNGFAEQIVSVPSGGRSYPLVLRDELIRALPYLKPRFTSYAAYATQTTTDVFPAAELEGALRLEARTFATSLLRNDGNGAFTLVPLPREAQIAPVYGILARDVDGDGITDLLLGGNFDGVEPKIGRMAASHGLLLRGGPAGTFQVVPARESGFRVPGQTRDIRRLRTRAGDLILVARNDDRPLLFRPVDRD